MKSGEFIKLLQKVDPKGNYHIRGFGGAIVDVALVEGYWDGSYSYMDGDVYVNTRKKSKIDVITYDLDSIISNYNGDMDKLRKKIKFDKGDENSWDYIEKKAAEYRKMESQSIKEFTFHVLEKYKAGVCAAQSITDPIGHYHVMWWHKDGDTRTQRFDENKISFGDVLNQGECGAVIKSGFFTPVQEGENYVWKLNI